MPPGNTGQNISEALAAPALLCNGDGWFHGRSPEAINPRQVLGPTMKRVQVASLKPSSATRKPRGRRSVRTARILLPSGGFQV